jgi:hypothetical protein
MRAPPPPGPAGRLVGSGLIPRSLQDNISSSPHMKTYYLSIETIKRHKPKIVILENVVRCLVANRTHWFNV